MAPPLGTMTPQNGATGRREQEPSTPSIELAFAKLKAFLRKAAARTIPDLWAAVAQAIETFEPGECARYFAHAGYDLD